MVKDNLDRVRERVSQAARAAGRDPADVRLICVTKGVSVERIREAVAAGVREIGENRVQEAQEKKEKVSDLRWHLIGRLQRNKAKLAVELFDVIHSVDSLELLEELEKRADRKLEVLIQVNVSGEATKGGCRPEEAEVLAEAALKGKNLRWSGLMTMAPYGEDPEAARPVFRKLRELRDRLQTRFGVKLDLSMGMSGDFETAVQEGATMVRVGTAIFDPSTLRQAQDSG